MLAEDFYDQTGREAFGDEFRRIKRAAPLHLPTLLKGAIREQISLRHLDGLRQAITPGCEGDWAGCWWLVAGGWLLVAWDLVIVPFARLRGSARIWDFLPWPLVLCPWSLLLGFW